MDTPHQLSCRQVWSPWPPDTCFHPCLFLSCSRTHSLGRGTGAAAGAAAPRTLCSRLCVGTVAAARGTHCSYRALVLFSPLWGRRGEPPMGRTRQSRVGTHLGATTGRHVSTQGPCSPATECSHGGFACIPGSHRLRGTQVPAHIPHAQTEPTAVLRVGAGLCPVENTPTRARHTQARARSPPGEPGSLNAQGPWMEGTGRARARAGWRGESGGKCSECLARAAGGCRETRSILRG